MDLPNKRSSQPRQFSLQALGLWGEELQPARDRAGVAGAAMGAHRKDATSSLIAAHWKPQVESDRRSVAGGGEFWRFGHCPTQNQPFTARQRSSTLHAASKNGRFRPDTNEVTASAVGVTADVGKGI